MADDEGRNPPETTVAADAEEQETAKSVGIIDMGSNSIRLVIAQAYDDGRTEVLERARQPVRLGHDTFVTGKLSQKTMRAALTILRDYRQLMDTYQVDLVRAVATSAVRDATNRDSFVDRVSRTVGLDVDVIEPTEQSRLMVSAVRSSAHNLLGSKRRLTMIAEVGGGSTLLTILRGGEITASQSYNLGSIRMQEMLATSGEPPVRAAELLRQFIANVIEMARKSLRLKSVKTFLAVGGDARFTVSQTAEGSPSPALQSVEALELDALVEKCIPLRPEELTRTYAMDFADAETLVPALLVYQALLHATGAEKMIVSQVSMRDGLLLDLPRYVAGQEDPELTKSIILSAKTIGAKYRCDPKHAEHVAYIAVRLFDRMQKEHRLSPRHRLLLQVAGLIHEAGRFVSSRAHHKHSYYLVANAEILGLRRQEIETVAHVARYHRRSMPKASHFDYMALPRDQRMVVNKLGAILRVADALDKGHWQQVRRFEVEREDQDLVIYVKGAGDLILERRAVATKDDMFEDIFGMRIRLEEQA